MVKRRTFAVTQSKKTFGIPFMSFKNLNFRLHYVGGPISPACTSSGSHKIKLNYRLNCRVLPRIHDDESHAVFLQNSGILHSTREYDNEHDMTSVSFSFQIRCRCRIRGCRNKEKGCENEFNTWLQGSKLPLRKFNCFIYLYSIIGHMKRHLIPSI